MKTILRLVETLLVILVAYLIIMFIFGLVSPAEGQGASPTPYITATAPLPTCKVDTSVPCFTPSPGVPHEENPPPFETATPSAYPPVATATPAAYPEGISKASSFQPADAGIWAWIWDLFTNE